jgi:hypothetical protein
MVGVGGLIRNSYGQIREQGSDEIERRMSRFGENSQAAGGDTDRDFSARYEQGG